MKKIYKINDIFQLYVEKENSKVTKTLQYTGTKIKHENIFELYPLVMKPEFFEFIKECTPFVSNVNWKGENISNPLTYFRENNPDYKNLNFEYIILVHNVNKVLFNYKETILSIPYIGDYIYGKFNNEHYQLKKLNEHLIKHPNIIKDFKNFELGIYFNKIIDVPVYDNKNNRTKYINVLILPKKEIYRNMYDKVKDNRFWARDLQNLVLGNGNQNNEMDHLNINQFRK